MIANKERCTDGDKTVCEVNEFTRLRFVHGMLLDDKDFQSEQQYHLSKRKFLNRMLHGAGVVCGLAMKGNKDGQSIEVTPGLALDCAGNEIWVSHSVKVDLTSILPPWKGKSAAECEEPQKKKPNTYYIGIRYDERATNPVAIYLPSGGCDERTCENSRYREGYCIEAVECCLEKPFPGLLFTQIGQLNAASTNDNEAAQPAPVVQPTRPEAVCGHCDGFEGKALEVCLELEKFCEQPVPCPQCCSCDKPCHVVLGKITVNEELRLQTICNNDCRRYVFTANLFQSMIVKLLGEDENHLVSSLLYNPVHAVCELLTELLKRYRRSEGSLPQNLNEAAKVAVTWVEMAQAAKVEEMQNKIAEIEKSHADLQQSVTNTHAEIKKSLKEVATASAPPPAKGKTK